MPMDVGLSKRCAVARLKRQGVPLIRGGNVRIALATRIDVSDMSVRGIDDVVWVDIWWIRLFATN